MARFPFTLDSDTTEVRDALEIARTQYSRGDLEDAMRWLRRAADIAFEQHADERAVSLSKAAADLGPPRPGAPPARATESVRPRAAESFPVNQALPPARPVAPPSRPASPVGAAHASPHARPVTAPASTTPAINAARAMERQSSSATASSPPASPSARPLLPTRPAPVQRAEFDGPTDAFRLSDDASTSEPIPLTARKVEPYSLDDDSTHVGAAPAGFLAAVAAEALLSQTTPASSNEKPSPRAPAPAKPAAQPAQRVAPSQPARPPASQPSPRAPIAAKPSAAPAPQPAASAKVAPQKSVARAPAATQSAASPAAAQPAQKAPAARPVATPAPQPAVAGSVAIGDADDEEDRTSPGIVPQALQAMVAAVKSKPPTHQALRVALSKGANGVSARVVGADGLRAGEVEVMVVGVSSDADLVALFS